MNNFTFNSFTELFILFAFFYLLIHFQYNWNLVSEYVHSFMGFEFQSNALYWLIAWDVAYVPTSSIIDGRGLINSMRSCLWRGSLPWNMTRPWSSITEVTHREIFSESCLFKPNLDCCYHFPIDLAPIGNAIGAVSIGKL